jgi:hypothetical protein
MELKIALDKNNKEKVWTMDATLDKSNTGAALHYDLKTPRIGKLWTPQNVNTDPKQVTAWGRLWFCDSIGSHRVSQANHSCAVVFWGYTGGGGRRGSVFADAGAALVCSARSWMRLVQIGGSAWVSQLGLVSKPDRLPKVPSLAFLWMIIGMPCF